MALPDDVVLSTQKKSTKTFEQLAKLCSGWQSVWPDPGRAPFMEEVCLLAGEEFDALAFNAVHGYYRQAIGCLRNALETVTIASALAVTNNTTLYAKWRSGQDVPFGNARDWLADSQTGKQVNAVSPELVFDKDKDGNGWLPRLYRRLCGYAHSRAGYNNADLWESNGPVYRPSALATAEAEFKETLAMCYLLLMIGWTGFKPTKHVSTLLKKPGATWEEFAPAMRLLMLAAK
jgi:hypothetical protein